MERMQIICMSHDLGEWLEVATWPAFPLGKSQSHDQVIGAVIQTPTQQI